MTDQELFDEVFGAGCDIDKAKAAVHETALDYNWPICGQCGETFCDCDKCEENCPCGQCCELIDEPTIQAVHALGIAAGMVR